MIHPRKLTAGVICGGVLFFCALLAPAFAASNPGNCAGTSGGATNACQFEVESYTQAPLPNVSMGIRFDAAVNNVLFNSFPSIGPRFVHNVSSNDIFVPQGSAGEFSSFLGAPPSGVTIDYAVVPRSYTAAPSPVNVACGTATPSSVSILVPTVANTTSPVVVNSYSLVLNPANPSTTQTTVGSTALWGSPAQFTYSRQDCSTDNEGNKNCVTVTFVEDQKLVFSATGTQPDFSWGVPVVTSGIYTNNSPADCSITYPPSINGVCGAANGASYAAAPSTGLCSSGNANAVTAGSGGVWTWICAGVSGGSDQSCATKPGSVCTPISQTRELCPSGATGSHSQQRDYTCSNGTGTWGAWYDTVNTCVQACVPTSQTQEVCPSTGYTGSHKQRRDYTCSGGTGTWGAWYDTSNTCVQVCASTSQTQELCPTGGPNGYTGSHTQKRDYTCFNGTGSWGAWYDTVNTCKGTLCPPAHQGAPYLPTAVWGPGFYPGGDPWGYYPAGGGPACEGYPPAQSGTVGQTVVIPSVPFVGMVGGWANYPHGTGSIPMVCAMQTNVNIPGWIPSPAWQTVLPGTCH